MLKYNFYLLVITLLTSFANTNPIKEFQPRGVCPAVNAIVSLFGAAAPASSYCSSYLKITRTTSTTTSTALDSVDPYGCNFCRGPAKRTAVPLIPERRLAARNPLGKPELAVNHAERGVIEARATPTKALAAAAISSGCSCLKLTTAAPVVVVTTTTTSTSTCFTCTCCNF